MKAFDTGRVYDCPEGAIHGHHAADTTTALRHMEAHATDCVASARLFALSQSVFFHARRPRMAAVPRSRGALGVTAAMPKAKDLRDCSKEELMQMVESAKQSMFAVKELKHRRDEVRASVIPSNSLTAIIA